jgi:tetratricopeptide (TPR) repeat protein
MLPILLFVWLAADTSAADQLFRAGRLADAVAAYRQVLASDPGSFEALAGAGRSLLLLNNPREAGPLLERAYRLKPDSGEIQLALAQAVVDVGNAGAATGLLESLVEKEPSNVQALRLLGEVLYRQGYFRNALTQLDTLAALHGDDVQARNFRAVSLAKVGELREAEAACKGLMDARPDALDMDVALTWVEILYDGGRYEAAIPYVDKLAAQQPDNPMAPLWKARLLLREGHLEQAAKQGELSISLAPALPLGHNVLLGIYRKAGRAQDAETQAQWMRAYNESRQ